MNSTGRWEFRSSDKPPFFPYTSTLQKLIKNKYRLRKKQNGRSKRNVTKINEQGNYPW